MAVLIKKFIDSPYYRKTFSSENAKKFKKEVNKLIAIAKDVSSKLGIEDSATN